MTQRPESVTSPEATTNGDGVVLSVHNFGPIVQAANIEIRPLTIFAGPGNTGKSYLATLLYTLQRVFNEDERQSSVRRIRFAARDIFDVNLFGSVSGEELAQLAEWSERFAEDDSVVNDAPSSLGVVEKLVTVLLLRRSSEVLEDELRRLTSANVEELLNWSATSGTLSVHTSDHSGGWQHTFTDGNGESAINIEAWASDPRNVNLLDLRPRDFRSRRWRMELIRSMRARSQEERVLSVASLLANNSRFRNWQGNAMFLPASRSGLIQAHQTIVGSVLRRVSLVGVEPLNVPTLTGVVADFLESWVSIASSKQRVEGNRNGVFAMLADQLAREVLHGDIEVETNGYSYPTFTYVSKGLEGSTIGRIPLERAASTVTESAPLVLWLRRYLSPGDMLILEEPEAHLHPHAQRAVAKILVLAVNAGLRVVITTHSPYILEQISNYIRYHAFDEAGLKQFTKRNPDGISIDPRMVACYSFRRTGDGVVVEPETFDPETGFYPDDHSDEEFDLHNEVAAILNSLET